MPLPRFLRIGNEKEQTGTKGNETNQDNDNDKYNDKYKYNDNDIFSLFRGRARRPGGERKKKASPMDFSQKKPQKTPCNRGGAVLYYYG